MQRLQARPDRRVPPLQRVRPTCKQQTSVADAHIGLQAAAASGALTPVRVSIVGASCILPGTARVFLQLPALRCLGFCTSWPGGRLGTSEDVQEVWRNLVNGADCISLPPKGRPVAAPRETSPAFETLGYSEAGQSDRRVMWSKQGSVSRKAMYNYPWTSKY